MTLKTSIIVLTLSCVALSSIVHTLLAFNLLDRRWPAGNITMEMQLGASGALIDGSADWDECAIAGLVQWNANLGGAGVSFTVIRNSTRTPAANDSVNSVFFADDIFGTPFGAQTLAVTQTFIFLEDGIDTTAESDVIFNNATGFNCYRGPIRLGPTPDGSSPTDLQRVAVHEFGHVLGLDHPDQATPPQGVHAIMNAFIGDIDALQLDDIQGALRLYGVSVVGIPFPPHDQVLTFFLNLENEYRDTLGRSRTNQGFVDAEGSTIWFPEWLRYVLNDCSVTEATNRVLLQIRGQGMQPVCGVVAQEVINFPPPSDALDFLNTLDTFYRNELSRAVELSYIDREGKAVWLQEYLRYRVNGCNDQQATDRVFQQVGGGSIAPVCSGGAPPPAPAPPPADAPPPPFGAGHALVGTNSPAGRYYTDPASGCIWDRLSGRGDTLSDVIAHEFIGHDAGQQIVDMLPTDVAFSTAGDCGTWFDSRGVVNRRAARHPATG